MPETHLTQPSTHTVAPGLLARALAMRERVKAHQIAKRRAGQLGTLVQLREQYETLHARVAAMRQAQATLQTLSVDVPDVLSPSLGDGARDDLEALSAEEGTLASQARTEARTAWLSYLRNALVAQEKVIRAAWQEWVDARVPVENPGLLGMLQELTSLRSTIQQMMGDYERVRLLRREMPSPDAVAKVHTLTAALSEAWRQVGGTEIPEDVASLLQAASMPEGASLDLLTPEVLAWIQARGVTESFKLSLLHARSR